MGLVKSDRQSEGDTAEAAQTPVRYFGTVKSFNENKGYGFIIPDGGGKDIFLHIRALERSGFEGYPHAGQRLQYELGPGFKPGNTEAKKIRKLGKH